MRSVSIVASSRLAVASALVLTACGDDADRGEVSDDDGIDAGSDTGSDGSVDAVSDAAVDTQLDAGDGSADPPPELPPEVLAVIAADIEASNATAASIAIWSDDRITWLGGFGTLPSGAPIGEDTLFMIGSDTKKLTAILALQAVERGELALDDTVASLLPALNMWRAPAFEAATLHDLLSHQGGIVDGVEDSSETTDAALAEYAYGDFASASYALAPPGVMWNYSNPNFSIAGLVLEVSDGWAWADILRADLIEPLGMGRTFGRKSEVDADVATGIGLDSSLDTEVGPVSLADTWESAYVRPAGLVWSTPSDQMRVARFLVDGDAAVLSDASRAELVAPQVPMFPDLPGSYGYGVMVQQGARLGERYYDVPVWFHGGNTWTHSSAFYIFPEQRFALSILSNGQGDDFGATVVALTELFADLPTPVDEPAPVFDASQLGALVGTYNDPNNAGELIITLEGDTLVLDAPTLEEYDVAYERVMEPISTRVWLVHVDGTTLDFAFVDGPDGETYFRNRSVVAVRAPTDKARWTPPPSVSPLTSRAALREAFARGDVSSWPAMVRPQR